MTDDYVKRSDTAPDGLFAREAAGLAWLAAAPGGAPCAEVLDHGRGHLRLRRLKRAPPERDTARDFGRRLAATHAAGAPAFGSGPPGWDGPAYFGPTDRPLPLPTGVHPRWGTFYAEDRLAPMLAHAAQWLDATTRADVDTVADRCRRGDFDDDTAPARLHGDLWSGNVVWTADDAVLIDPAAHGGHPESDLAMLALFGLPHLDTVSAGYHEVAPPAPRWETRIGLHQLFALLAHVALFGRGYTDATARAARSALSARPPG